MKKPCKVYYFKPDSFVTENPEKQRLFRDKIIQNIKALPKLETPKLMADDLQASYRESLQDKANPSEMRKLLGEYFKRRQYSLQHKRYKILLRWSRYALRSRNIDTIAKEANFRMAKIQAELESVVKRVYRLSAEDDYLFA